MISSRQRHSICLAICIARAETGFILASHTALEKKKLPKPMFSAETEISEDSVGPG